MLKVRSHSMFATAHSWAITMRSIFYEFEKNNCKLFIKSTNGNELLPDEWFRHTLVDFDDADIDICYTLPRNFNRRFKPSSLKKMAIYNYESSIMPKDWLDNYKNVDYVLPSSNFSKNILLKNGWPEEKCIVIPHGINKDLFKNKKTFNLKNNKSFRFLNVSIPHYRKNIPLLVDCYYEAFSSLDDVCLVIKTNVLKNKIRNFEINLLKELKKIQEKYLDKNLPQLEIVDSSLENMVPLYNSCDCLISTSSSEGFGLPMLEAMAANLLVVSTGKSGQSDFLHKDNSLEIEVYKDFAPPQYQYWEHSDGATTFFPKRDSIIENMINAYKNKEYLLSKFDKECKKTISKYTWESAVSKILELS
mgnify:CR=1 FL=1